MQALSNLVGHIGLRINAALRELAKTGVSTVLLPSRTHAFINLRQSDFESLLYVLQYLLVLLAADEADTEALGTETTRTTDAVQIRV